KGRVLVPLAYMDFDEYIEELKSEREVLSKDINKALKDIEKRPENKKAYNKKENLEKQLIENKQKIDEAKALEETHSNELPISAAFFNFKPFEVVYYAGVTSNELRDFTRNYAILLKMIKYVIDYHIDRYNFYGISGDSSGDAEDALVVKFKKYLKGDVV